MRNLTTNETSSRIAQLAFQFMNYRNLTTEQIYNAVYKDFDTTDSSEALRKAFLRDRNFLSTLGFTIKYKDKSDGKRLWYLDKSNSLEIQQTFSPADVLLLLALCEPLLHNPDFTQQDDLRVALIKLRSLFPDAKNFHYILHNPGDKTETLLHRRIQNIANKLKVAIDEAHVVRMMYEKLDGSLVEKNVAAWGLFSVWKDEVFLVAPEIQNDKPGIAHTYNLKRIQKLSIDATRHIPCPLDFDIDDYLLLPFQLGPTLYTAKVACTQQQKTELISLNQNQINFIDDKYFEVSVADTFAAARWCIAHDVLPIEPQELVDATFSVLKEQAHV